MEYDYWRYSELISKFVEDARPHPDDLSIGEDISTMPEVKIIFDGFGDLETEDDWFEGGNKNMESYAVFIHKDALTEEFVFPEHDTWFAIVHRPKDEVCIYVWYDVENDDWEVLQLEDRLDENCAMDENAVMHILEELNKKYYDE